MESARQVVFGPFRLDPLAKRLWCGAQEVALQPQPLAVLHYLVTHAGRVVTKEELLTEVWAGTHVTKTALKVCVHAIRVALGDSVATSRYLETVGRRGYQFVGLGPAAVRAPKDEQPVRYPVVGREREVARLEEWLARARHGDRQLVFLTGELGIGKTTVVDQWLARVRTTEHVWVGRGQCLEQYGEGEAYLPILEALGELWGVPGGLQILEVLQHYAPTWVLQMPALVQAVDLAMLQRTGAGATRERMLREMAEALAALTAVRPLVLVLEDLQWSDRATLDLLAYVAQRRERARLLLLGTYRPADLVARAPALQGLTQGLQAHGLCQEVRLQLLTEAGVRRYVAQRCGAQRMPEDFAGQIHRRTDGNALFMVTLVDYYLQHAMHALGCCASRWARRRSASPSCRACVSSTVTLERFQRPEHWEHSSSGWHSARAPQRSVWRPTRNSGPPCTTSGSSLLPGPTWSRVLPSPTRWGSGPRCSMSTWRLGCGAWSMPPSPYGAWAIRRRPSSTRKRRWPGPGRSPIPKVWCWCSILCPGCIITAATCQRSRPRPRPC
jgi:DNA-binding winged helix-turn-helix (wHTH) protein